MEKFDIAFLGGGPAGYEGAVRAAQLGARVAVIEAKFLGGVCLNWGCIPTKTVRASAEVARTIRRAREFGFEQLNPTPDIKAIISRKERVVTALRGSVERLFQANKVALFQGQGRLVSQHSIEVENEGTAKLVEASKIVVCAGSSPASLDIIPKSPRVFLADETLNISYLPKHILVIGGGVVGVEMAAIFRELGSQITIVEALDRILPGDDVEMATYLRGILQRRKIKILCGVTVTEAAETEEGFDVKLSSGAVITPDTIIISVGRRFNTTGIGLNKLGIEMDRGRIVVDEHLKTNIPSLYAAGDVIGGWLLAHVAFAEGICAAENALGRDSKMDYKVVPRCVFTIPEYAAVGLSEEQASSQHKIKVARFPLKSLGMGQAMGEVEGLVKLMADAETDQILGCHVIGPHGSDLVAEIAVCMRGNLTSKVVMDTIHSHPTLSEAILETAQALHGQAIHIAPEGVKQ
ncbi:MAG: dihydrolipoyl dehydrogenase [Desulfomonilaceae bacterium]